MKLVCHKMLKYLLLMFVFISTIHAETVDVSNYSASKTVDKHDRIKRAFLPAETKNEIKPKLINETTATQNITKVVTDVKVNEVVHETDANVSTKTVITEAPVIIKKNDSDTHIFPILPHGREHIGAAMRSFWVFLGLSVIVVAYFTFRAFK